ncbi:diphosphomevalonate decarboxylase [Aureococcus anophagefferens]|uniref:Diphosphomevalonate decarboxylase n=1 Tax=Aureococcus anophagefferens TaxID=44056 RepID=A0ABR1FYE5_AURAN
MALGTPAPPRHVRRRLGVGADEHRRRQVLGQGRGAGGNTPINSSCSLTLDPADLRAETVMVASPELDRDELWLNGAPVDVAGASTHAAAPAACDAALRVMLAR